MISWKKESEYAKKNQLKKKALEINTNYYASKRRTFQTCRKSLGKTQK